MKRVKPSVTAHSSLNSKMMWVLSSCDANKITVNFKLADRLKERNLSARKVAEMTGLRVATISNLCTGKKGSINIQHILLLMLFLRITDIRELVDIQFPVEWVNTYESEKDCWIKEGEVPEQVKLFTECLKLEDCSKCNMEGLFDFCERNTKEEERNTKETGSH